MQDQHKDIGMHLSSLKVSITQPIKPAVPLRLVDTRPQASPTSLPPPTSAGGGSRRCAGALAAAPASGATAGAAATPTPPLLLEAQPPLQRRPASLRSTLLITHLYGKNRCGGRVAVVSRMLVAAAARSHVGLPPPCFAAAAKVSPHFASCHAVAPCILQSFISSMHPLW